MAEASAQHWDLPYHDIYLKYLLSALDEQNSSLNMLASVELSELEKKVFIAVLSDMVHQVGILNGGTVETNQIASTKKPIAERFEAPILKDLYDERTLQPFAEALGAICKTKLENSLTSLRDLLVNTLHEIGTTGTFETLKEFVASKNRTAYEEYQLLNEYMESSTEQKELTEKWKRLQKFNSKFSDNLKIFNAESEEQRNEMRRVHEMEKNMVKKWEEARIEQATNVFKHELATLERRNESIRKQISNDLLTIEWLKVYNECKYKRIENSIEYWTERCAVEKKNLGDEIVNTKKKIQEVWSKYDTLRDSYRERDAFIENYRVEQKLLQSQREHEMKQRNAAIYIQAWWRGTMVRKCLGPYKPKKKKGKKGGKN